MGAGEGRSPPSRSPQAPCLNRVPLLSSAPGAAPPCPLDWVWVRPGGIQSTHILPAPRVITFTNTPCPGLSCLSLPPPWDSAPSFTGAPSVQSCLCPWSAGTLISPLTAQMLTDPAMRSMCSVTIRLSSFMKYWFKHLFHFYWAVCLHHCVTEVLILWIWVLCQIHVL